MHADREQNVQAVGLGFIWEWWYHMTRLYCHTSLSLFLKHPFIISDQRIDIGFKQGLRNCHDNYEVNVDGLACFIVVGVITWRWKEVYDAV